MPSIYIIKGHKPQFKKRISLQVPLNKNTYPISIASWTIASGALFLSIHYIFSPILMYEFNS